MAQCSILKRTQGASRHSTLRIIPACIAGRARSDLMPLTASRSAKIQTELDVHQGTARSGSSPPVLLEELDLTRCR
eukprot:383172-Pelagomonas_calceolata.AAC.2